MTAPCEPNIPRLERNLNNILYAAGQSVDAERRAEVLELYPPFELLHYDIVEAIPPAYIAPVEPLWVAPVPRKTLQLRYEKDQRFIILLETEWLLFARTKWGLSPFANPDDDPHVEYTRAEEALLNRVELASGQLYNVCHLHPFMGKPLSHRKLMLEIAYAELVRAVDLLKKWGSHTAMEHARSQRGLLQAAAEIARLVFYFDLPYHEVDEETDAESDEASYGESDKDNNDSAAAEATTNNDSESGEEGPATRMGEEDEGPATQSSFATSAAGTIVTAGSSVRKTPARKKPKSK
jgi:hypothetical protein